MRRTFLRILTLAGLLASAGCGDTPQRLPVDVDEDAHVDAAEPDASDLQEETDAAEPTPEPFTWALGEPGPYRVGHRTLPVTFTHPALAEPRTVTLHLWYPTEDTTGEPAAYLGLFPDEASFEGATLAPPHPAYPGGYPVHVHSHGHMGFAGSSPSLMRHFATHGWVVAAPDHTGNTLLDTIQPRPSWMYWVRGHDVTASLDALAALPPADPLAGQLALGAVVMSGHSFGGYTTFAVAGASYDLDVIEAGCADGSGPAGACTEADLDVFAEGTRDPRVVAAIPMAAGNRKLFGDAGFDAVAVPVLMMTGDADESVTNANEGDPTWAALDGPAIRVDIAGGCHQIFGLGECEAIGNDEGFQIVNAYALAFARAHVLGDTTVDALLAGDVTVSPAASFDAKP